MFTVAKSRTIREVKMYNKRWFKVLAAFALLASVAFTVSPKGADVPTSAFSNCEAALRRGPGTVLPSGLSDREICYRLPQLQGSSSSAASLLAAIANRGGFTVNTPTWGDAGAARPLAPALASVASGSMIAGGGFMASPVASAAPTFEWGDAGAGRPVAAIPLPASAGWSDAGAGHR